MESKIALELFALFCIGFLGALTPGPDVLFTLRNTLSYGAKAGFLSVFGIFLGWLVFLSLIYFGLTHFLSSAFMQGVLSAIGGIYLCYIAFLLLRTKPKLQFQNTQFASTNPSLVLLIPKGLFVNLSNPKAILFFGVIITPFMQQHLLLSLSVLLSSLISAFILIILLAVFFKKFINDSLFNKIDKICGILFLFFAFFLLTESYNQLIN
ncbi:LysE family translocator [uncultured Helicobacter sp.]|uniref:LysE family translocator n=1 Tax=uncultured Helicobacter sp. TaxID=175537 RepID=UPI002620553B|nr:LysE family translocator [uncultured Helicobacter sp.]